VSDRQTVILERDGNGSIADPRFQQWRGRQRYSAAEDTGRMLRR
jgi:hypothetical protein